MKRKFGFIAGTLIAGILVFCILFIDIPDGLVFAASESCWIEDAPADSEAAWKNNPEDAWQYCTFAEAIENVSAGGIVVLLSDVQLSSGITISKSVTITSNETQKPCVIRNMEQDTDDRKENTAGCLFMDCCNESFDDRNVVIYGHNMLDRTMFGSLKDVFQEKFWEDSERDLIWITDTKQHLRKYKIFSYYIEEEDYYITTSFSDAAAYTGFLREITARSFQKLDVTVTADDHILTLSTCAGAAGTNKRRVIHAKLIGTVSLPNVEAP